MPDKKPSKPGSKPNSNNKNTSAKKPETKKPKM